MARINRSDVIQKAVNDLALSGTTDIIPSETLDKVQCVYSLNKQFSSLVLNTSSVGTGTMTITLPTVSPGSEIFITALNFGMIKDSTNDMASGRVTVAATPENNILSAICAIPILTLTAQSENITMAFPYPLKLKSGTTISSTMTFTAGTAQRALEVIGFVTSSN